MEPETPRTRAERNMLPAVGATFLRGEDGQVLFQFVIDTANIIGPRPANRFDQDRYPGEWKAFLVAEEASQLDRDADGEPGGSLPAESAPEAPAAPRKRRAKQA